MLHDYSDYHRLPHYRKIAAHVRQVQEVVGIYPLTKNDLIRPEPISAPSICHSTPQLLEFEKRKGKKTSLQLDDYFISCNCVSEVYFHPAHLLFKAPERAKKHWWAQRMFALTQPGQEGFCGLMLKPEGSKLRITL